MKTIIIGAFLLLSIAGTVHAGPNYISGTLTSYTTVTDGVLLMIDNGVPDNCQGTPSGWILVPETRKAMTAMAIAAIVSGKKNIAIYTEGLVNGWCVANQVAVGF